MGGGKFANGAMGAAFVMLFNHLYEEATQTMKELNSQGRRGLWITHEKGESGYYVTDDKGFKYASNTAEMRQHLESFKQGLGIPLTIVEYSAGGVISPFIMVPYDFYSGANFISIPYFSPAGIAGKVYSEFFQE